MEYLSAFGPGFDGNFFGWGIKRRDAGVIKKRIKEKHETLLARDNKFRYRGK